MKTLFRPRMEERIFLSKLDARSFLNFKFILSALYRGASQTLPVFRSNQSRYVILHPFFSITFKLSSLKFYAPNYVYLTVASIVPDIRFLFPYFPYNGQCAVEYGSSVRLTRRSRYRDPETGLLSLIDLIFHVNNPENIRAKRLV